jgi:hypothetical protein
MIEVTDKLCMITKTDDIRVFINICNDNPCYMLQFAYDLSVSHSTACHLQRIDVYVDNAILYQLCLLVFQRLALIIEQTKSKTRSNAKHISYKT